MKEKIVIKGIGEYTHWYNIMKETHNKEMVWVGGKPMKFPYTVEWEVLDDCIKYKIENHGK